ncbi:hypothetical protein R3X27_25350 [Tropicimonas sp. TH_r6]|nr:hypothetical protein [Tropicimonas sp. TH_r6]
MGLVQDLYRLSPENTAFLNARLLQQPASKQTLTPYKKRIRSAVCPNEPWKQSVRLSEGRKAISEFRKANGNARDTLTLMTYYVQCGNDFTLEFGDIDERFYDSLCSMAGQIKDRLLKEQYLKLADEILPLLEKEFERIDGLMGWGYPDEFGDHLEELRDAFKQVS